MRLKGIDAFVVSALPHVRYLTNFTGSNALFVLRARSSLLLTDSRYQRQVRLEMPDLPSRITRENLIDTAASVALKDCSNIGFESEHLPHNQYRRLRKGLPGTRILPLSGLVESLTQVKRADEIRLIRQAIAISERVYRLVLDRLRPGVRELDIAAEISYLHKRNGAEMDAFEPIVVSGPRSAMPHARPTEKRIKKGETIVLDLGCCLKGYHSDLTRTVVLGRASTEVRRMYAAVVEAGKAAVEAAGPLMAARELDGIARKKIAAAGFGKYFVHSLGHGIGLRLHERPRISPLSKDRLQAGNVITIEPGVYIPRIGGVRIEDDILLTGNGCEVLTHSSRNLEIV
jgi:Xaa-Pro aminopeptidase